MKLKIFFKDLCDLLIRIFIFVFSSIKHITGLYYTSTIVKTLYLLMALKTLLVRVFFIQYLCSVGWVASASQGLGKEKNKFWVFIHLSNFLSLRMETH